MLWRREDGAEVRSEEDESRAGGEKRRVEGGASEEEEPKRKRLAICGVERCEMEIEDEDDE